MTRRRRRELRHGWAGRVALLAVVAATACGGGGGAPTGGGGSGGSAGGNSGAGGSTGTGGGGGGATAGMTLAEGEDGPSSIALDGTNVYWTTRSAVRRMPKAGGTPTSLFSAQELPSDMIADDQNLYWANRTARRIMRGAKTGGQGTPIGDGFGGLGQDAEFVYWLVDSTTTTPITVMRARKDGSGTPELLGSAPSLEPLAVDGQFIYWPEANMGRRVQRMPKAGGAATDIYTASADRSVAVVRLDETSVYFATRQLEAKTSTLEKLPKAGGAAVTLAGSLDAANAIAIAAGSVYWIARDDAGLGPGYLARIPASGGTPITIASDVQSPIALAVDAEHAYWAEFGQGVGTGRIRRVAR
jgi:hypothetical protein